MSSTTDVIGFVHESTIFIGKISELDEFSRNTFCQNRQWDLLQMLTAYTTCVINMDFKCDIFSTLSALGKSQESSQKLMTIFVENDVLSIIADEHKMVERGTEKRRCPLIDAMLNFLTTIIMASTERFEEITPFLKFIFETILLTSYDW